VVSTVIGLGSVEEGTVHASTSSLLHGRWCTPACTAWPAAVGCWERKGAHPQSIFPAPSLRARMSVHAEQCRCVCARGQTPDEKEALAAIKEAYDLGINFWDVAPFYGGGSAERVPPAASPLPRERVAPPATPRALA